MTHSELTNLLTELLSKSSKAQLYIRKEIFYNHTNTQTLYQTLQDNFNNWNLTKLRISDTNDSKYVEILVEVGI